MLDREWAHAEYVCLSSSAYVEAIKNNLCVSIVSDYVKPGEHDFIYAAYSLAQEWLAEVFKDHEKIVKDSIPWLEFNLYVFFSVTLAAKEFIKSLVEAKSPTDVTICSYLKRPIIGSWSKKDEQGDIFARVCEDYLKQKGIKCNILWIKSERKITNHRRSLKGKIIGYNKIRIVKSYFAKLLLYVPAYALLVKIRFQKLLFSKPLILMCGSAAETVYQGQLEHYWHQSRKWQIIRFEPIDRNPLSFRNRTCGSREIQHGIDRELLETLGGSLGRRINKIIFKNENTYLINNHFTWAENVHSELGSVLNNKLLTYQYKAMIDFVLGTMSQIDVYVSALKKIRPELILTHTFPVLPIAARLADVKSIIPLEQVSIPVFPNWPAVGDVRTVNGPLSKRAVELYDKSPRKIVDTGCSFVSQKKLFDISTRQNITEMHTPNSKIKVVLLAPCSQVVGPVFVEDIIGIAELFKKLKQMVCIDLIDLIIKLHPRYGDAEYSMDLMEMQDVQENVKITATPDLMGVLESADIVLFVENSGAVIETMLRKKPILWLSYLHPKGKDSQIACDFFDKYIMKISSLTELEDKIKMISYNDEVKREIFRKQSLGLDVVLSASNGEAAENIAKVCDMLMNGTL